MGISREKTLQEFNAARVRNVERLIFSKCDDPLTKSFPRCPHPPIRPTIRCSLGICAKRYYLLSQRCVEEREEKLQSLTENISQSMANSTPVRKTKLAYLDTTVKPPRNVARSQVSVRGVSLFSRRSCEYGVSVFVIMECFNGARRRNTVPAT